MSHSQKKKKIKESKKQKKKREETKSGKKENSKKRGISLHCEFCSIVLVSVIVFGLLELVLGT